MRLLGAVLAGGESRRFGSDKALALLDGKPLIQHAVDALAAQTDAVIVCGRDWGDGLPDRPEPGLGPLGGIAAALHEAARRGYDAVLTTPCDVPGLPTDLVRRLGDGGVLAEMPVIGLWPTALAASLDAWLRDGRDRSVRGWARAAGLAEIRLGTRLANINRPADLDEAVRGGRTQD
ncbi:MAG: molybdenum cofactor guanylyltransferase [Pseudomonadota bacterium]